MGIRLGFNQYGKSENRVVRVYRETPRHELIDLNVSTSLRGDFSAAHLVGDQADVLPTDTQKNTAFSYAKEIGVRTIEDYALALGRHFLDATPKATGARIEVDEYTWERIDDHDHAFVKNSKGVRTTIANVESTGEAWVVAGIKDLVILKTTGSEFHGFLKDEYTFLQETTDRIMATSLDALWRYDVSTGVDWNKTYDAVTTLLMRTFADHHSLALQQTLFAMGEAVLEAHPEVAEIRFTAPNKHHFVYDLERFGVENDNEVFIADDRPYGLIQAVVERDDASDPGFAWHPARLA